MSNNPVPPAGDVEVQRYKVNIHAGATTMQRQVVLAKDFEAHVTRLTAERDQQRKLKMILAERVTNAEANCSVYRVQRDGLTVERDGLLAEVERLTKQSKVKRYGNSLVGGCDVEVSVPGLIHYDHGPNLAEALARLAYRVSKFHGLDAPSLSGDALQSDLTKALELLRGVCKYADELLAEVNYVCSCAGSTGPKQTHKDLGYSNAMDFFAHQSAPAAKGETR